MMICYSKVVVFFSFSAVVIVSAPLIRQRKLVRVFLDLFRDRKRRDETPGTPVAVMTLASNQTIGRIRTHSNLHMHIHINKLTHNETVVQHFFLSMFCTFCSQMFSGHLHTVTPTGDDNIKKVQFSKKSTMELKKHFSTI